VQIAEDHRVIGVRVGEDFVDAFDAVEGCFAVDGDFGEEFEDDLGNSLVFAGMFTRGRRWHTS
jgi:hypothetical protein